jgi:biofilm PGA synthesis protein PgaD
MKEIIINQPHLQSFKQRMGSWFLSTLSWLLWLYFLFPLFTLGGWLMGVKSWSDEIRWFGGYKTLLELLEFYGQIIVMIGFGWFVWTFFLSWLHASLRTKTKPPISNLELSEKFKVDSEHLLASAKRSKDYRAF